jgi:hypothetical protein
MTETAKRRVRDYAGIAALVTALGTLVWGTLDRMNIGEQSEALEGKNTRLAESIFNASREQLAIVEYRLGKLEEAIEKLDDRLDEHEHRRRGSRRPASIEGSSLGLSGGGVETMAAGAMADEAEEAPAPPDSFEQIQQVVEQGEVWKGKD